MAVNLYVLLLQGPHTAPTNPPPSHFKFPGMILSQTIALSTNYNITFTAFLISSHYCHHSNIFIFILFLSEGQAGSGSKHFNMMRFFIPKNKSVSHFSSSFPLSNSPPIKSYGFFSLNLQSVKLPFSSNDVAICNRLAIFLALSHSLCQQFDLTAQSIMIKVAIGQSNLSHCLDWHHASN